MQAAAAAVLQLCSPSVAHPILHCRALPRPALSELSWFLLESALPRVCCSSGAGAEKTTTYESGWCRQACGLPNIQYPQSGRGASASAPTSGIRITSRRQR